MAERVGQRFGSYRLTQLLGRGGFAEVYLAEHLRLKRLVVVPPFANHYGRLLQGLAMKEELLRQ